MAASRNCATEVKRYRERANRSQSPLAESSARKYSLDLETKITKNMVLVLFVFMISYLPMALCLIISDSAILGAYCFAIFNISSAVNPVLFRMEASRFPEGLSVHFPEEAPRDRRTGLVASQTLHS